jgi:hypothetical protein
MHWIDLRLSEAAQCRAGVPTQGPVAGRASGAAQQHRS